MKTLSKTVTTDVRVPKDSEKEAIEQLMNVTVVPADMLAKVRGYAENSIERFRDNGVSDFDYSEKSVEFMSEIIDQEGPGYSEKAKNMLPTLWGSYYGEALIKRYGGSWVIAGNGRYAVKLNNGHLIFPMLRVDMHINNGRQDSIYAQYLSIASIN